MANLIKIVFDNNYDYKFAIGGDKGVLYLPNVPYDANFKSQGYERYLIVNGSIYYKNKDYDACGIEIIEGEPTQEVDWDFYNDMACIVLKGQDKLIFARQEDITSKVNNKEVYCGITGIGIMLNGEKYPYGTAFTSQYNAKSGRTLIGVDKDGNFLSYSIKGETGKSGLYGKELYDIAKANGFYTCLCLDGGGSVYRQFNGKVDISTTRKIKNNFIIYRKKKAPQPEPTDEYKKLYEEEKAKNVVLTDKINKIKEIVK